MTNLHTTTMRLSTVIQDGYDLLAEFKFAYQRLADLMSEFPKSMTAEKDECRKLMAEMAAQSRELKAEVKAANVSVAHITGHVAWKAAVRNCFGEEGLQQCYAYFEEQKTEEGL